MEIYILDEFFKKYGENNTIIISADIENQINGLN